MINFNDIQLKLYYSIAPLLLKHRELQLSQVMQEKINLFIYFDYEREFSGQDTNITDDDIKTILDILAVDKILTTWFTVGRIFKKYPVSIRAIQEAGHEIGSHTYAHISPLTTSSIKLDDDFALFKKDQADINVKGFHSPMGQWSISMLKKLTSLGFTYDLSGGKKSIKRPFVVFPRGRQKLLRFTTLGDDWPLFASQKAIPDSYVYFKTEIDKLQPGDLAGFGFHPWILASDTAILKGFSSFIRYLGSRRDILIEPVSSFVNRVESYNSGE
jgi:peptidoglycan/xylan/chitin deacetylase (PgdA/CDA1 family)